MGCAPSLTPSCHVCAQLRSHVRLFATPRAVACQAPLSVGFPRQEHWSGLPFPSLGDLPDPGIEPTSPVDSLPTEAPGKPVSPQAVLRSLPAPGHPATPSSQLSCRNSESESRPVVCDSLQPHELHSPWNFPGQILEWVAFPFSRGTFPTQELNPCLPHCRQILYQLSHQGSPRTLEWAACPFSRASS